MAGQDENEEGENVLKYIYVLIGGSYTDSAVNPPPPNAQKNAINSLNSPPKTKKYWFLKSVSFVKSVT